MKAGLRSVVTKGVVGGLLAAVMILAAPPKAEAQVSIGVQIGGPVYRAYPPPPPQVMPYGPRPGYWARRDYYERMRWERARRAEWARRQAWRSHYYGYHPGYGYGRGR